MIEDRLSRVDDSANATYLELVHPASVYRVSILTINDETKKKEVVKANIRLDELALIGIRLKRAEEKLFDMRFDLATPGPSGGESGGIFQTAAFTERFKIAPPSFPDWKIKLRENCCCRLYGKVWKASSGPQTDCRTRKISW